VGAGRRLIPPTPILGSEVESREMAKLKLTDKIALAAFIAGIAFIGVGMALIDAGHLWIKAGIGTWLLAYWLVLIENYASGRPVQTRGGVTRREDGRWAYTAPFVPLAVMGLVAVIIAVTF